MFYYEQRTIMGRWSPRTSPERPSEKKPAGSQDLKIRNIQEVPACLDHLSLGQLEAVLGTEGHLRGAHPRPAPEAPPAPRPAMDQVAVDLIGLVADLVDPDPCVLDHHGNCQTHGWTIPDVPCPHERARAVLGKDCLDG